MALGTTLPVWPAIVFTYFEPLALILGVHAVYSDPATFITKQLPVTPTSALTSIPDAVYVLAYSYGNIFLLLGLIAILCTVVTRDVKVTKYYLAIIACGDIGHLYANYKGMGPEIFWDFSNYNDLMIGNVWVTVFLWVNRIATLAGVFGRVQR